VSDAIRDQARSQIETQIETLLAEIYEPDGVYIWMTSPHRWFSGKSAVEMIAEGRASEVLAAVNRLIG
jgi:hypothetical protein